MFKKIIPINLMLLFLLTACTENVKKKEESVTKPETFFNLAYQENYKKDTIKSVSKKAHNAYILIDPFDDGAYKAISKLKLSNNQIAGYISVGTGEEFREDFSLLKPYLTPKSWPEWPDEFYISTVNEKLLEVMKKRIDKMALWGIDWVEFDNMDWLTNETRKKYKLKSLPKEAHAYVNELCDYTHSKNMKCMAKNMVEGFENFDGVTYESYHNEKNWWDVEGAKRFIADNKLVIINHYNELKCNKVYKEYQKIYGKEKVLFICEDRKVKKYKHF